MIRITLTIITLLTLTFVQGQDNAYSLEIKNYQDTLNKEYANPEESPLTEEDLKTFKSLEFFPINQKYRIEAQFIRTPNEKPFKMATTTSRKPIYVKYGEAHFTLEGEKIVLEIYQNQKLKLIEKYENYLFLPFVDETNGFTSYGGGRFLDLKIPSNELIVIDFNKSYNPYCAYNHKYSCPKPPKENTIPIKILAGVKAYENH